MAAPKTLHACQSCGFQSPKWLGRCPECGAWDSFAEEMAPARSASKARRAKAPSALVRPLSELDDEHVPRYSSCSKLVDRVLGGGIVRGAAVLLAGEPGIGKSTLLLQLGAALAEARHKVVYVSAEESPRQLRLRAERLGCGDSSMAVVGETQLEPILAALDGDPPEALLVDSVQALRSLSLDGPPGSIGQVRHVADRLVELAKRSGTAVFLVGHVTKEGAIAGPKSLEHLVDTVLTFEGDSHSEHRLLRAQKNRFGPTGEVAMFEMHDSGLEEVADPSRVLLARRRQQQPGSAVLASLHGSRPLLVEVQALVHPTSFPSPRRMSVGLDSNRVTLLVAVLERFVGLGLHEHDLFLNVVGGLTVKEPAADLAVAAAILSAVREEPLPEGMAFFGEIGLLGETRPVSRTESRLREIAALGFHGAVVPPLDAAQTPRGLSATSVEDVGELAATLVRGKGASPTAQ